MAEHPCPTCDGTGTISETRRYTKPSQVERERLLATGKKVPEPKTLSVVGERDCVRCGGTGRIVKGET